MKVVIVTGMPRSGTSWLAQIINSHPEVIFRMEPLFAYRFKNVISTSSSCGEVSKFIDNLVDVDDDFMLQRENQKKGGYPVFEKSTLKILLFKTTRHHELLEKYLRCLPNLEIFGIIRHPCGAINSWINSEREFAKRGCNLESDWRSGKCRKDEIGEYWGFDDWVKVTKHFIALHRKYPNFHLIRYADLVNSTSDISSHIFKKIDIVPGHQTENFLKTCHSRHDNDPYAVYKSKQVLNAWKISLKEDVASTIIRETIQNDLMDYLN